MNRYPLTGSLLVISSLLTACGAGPESSMSSGTTEQPAAALYNDIRLANGHEVAGTIVRNIADIVELAELGSEIGAGNAALFSDLAQPLEFTLPCLNNRDYFVRAEFIEIQQGALAGNTLTVDFGAHNGDPASYCLLNDVALSGAFVFSSLNVSLSGNGDWSMHGRIIPTLTRHDGTTRTLLKDIRNSFTISANQSGDRRNIQLIADAYGVITTTHDPQTFTYTKEILNSGFTINTSRDLATDSFTLEPYGPLHCSRSGTALLSLYTGNENNNEVWPITWSSNSLDAPHAGMPISGVLVINQTGINQAGSGSSINITLNESYPQSTASVMIIENNVTSSPESGNENTATHKLIQTTWPELVRTGLPAGI